MADDDSRVLLRATVNAYDAHTTFGRRAGRWTLLAEDLGCSWVDGRTREQWGLPDSPVPGRPTLAAVVRAETFIRTDSYTRLPESYLLLVATDGTRLATLAHVSLDLMSMQEADLERMWPARGFDALVARGVELRTEHSDDIGELEQRYPGTVSRLDRMTVSRRAWLVIYTLLGLMTVLAFLIAWRST